MNKNRNTFYISSYWSIIISAKNNRTDWQLNILNSNN